VLPDAGSIPAASTILILLNIFRNYGSASRGAAESEFEYRGL